MGSPCRKAASEVVAMLGLQPHPDGGFYKETLRDDSIVLSRSQLPPRYKVDRAISSAIYFLLPSGSVAYLHRLPCAETFHFYTGEPVTVFELHDGGKIKLTIVGPDLETGQLFHYTVPPNTWFGCFPTLDVESSSPDGSSLKLAAKRDPEHHYTVLGVTCAPAFQFQDNELATSAELIALAPEAEPFIRYLGPSK